MMAKPDRVLFERRTEAQEGAFSVLAPVEWLMEGGILRIDPAMQSGSLQSVSAKVDVTIKRDPEGTVLIRALPEILYWDQRMSATAMLGINYPPGSVAQRGMIAYPWMSVSEYLMQIAFPTAHPGVSDVQVVEERALPEEVHKYRQKNAQAGAPGITLECGRVVFRYREGGAEYLEWATTILQNLGPMSAGMWSNLNTLIMRAPVEDFEGWFPVLEVIRHSTLTNPRWQQDEAMAQSYRMSIILQAQQAEQWRAQQALDAQRAINWGTTHQNQAPNWAPYNNPWYPQPHYPGGMHPGAMGPMPYVPPPPVPQASPASDQWLYRWLSPNGDEFYSDHVEDDPNRDKLLGRSDWQLSQGPKK